MDIVALSTSVVWVDFITIVLSKIFNFGRSMDLWYKRFGIVAVLSDCLVIILGILLTQFIFPNASLIHFIVFAVCIQLIHDFLFFVLVIKKVPLGDNSIIDLFKQYSEENSYKILIADSTMVASSIILYTLLKRMYSNQVSFLGLLGAYALTYIIYTK